MPPTTGSRHAIKTCTFHLHSWQPFHLLKTLATPNSSSKPHKRPIETLDLSNLSLFDDGGGSWSSVKSRRRERMRWMARKRRRRGSRSVSSDRRRCCSVGGSNASNAYGTCSDYVMVNGVGTDSSGELFDVNWASDASEVGGRCLRRDGCDKENTGLHHSCVSLDGQGNESGYGSEPGYRGDVELGYGDDVDEEEDDTKVLFWGNGFVDTKNMDIIGKTSLQKAHHRCRRKKHEFRLIDAV